MVEITPSNDCGNSPKNQFAEQIAIATELRDREFLAGALAPEAEWELENGDTLNGDALSRHLVDSKESCVSLTVEHVVTHGKAGAVNGTLKLKSGSSRRFCHVMEFKNTKCREVVRLVSYGTLR